MSLNLASKFIQYVLTIVNINNYLFADNMGADFLLGAAGCNSVHRNGLNGCGPSIESD